MSRRLVCGPVVVAEMVAHADSEHPNEACGLLVGAGEEVIRFEPAVNVDASPVSYTVDPEDHYRVLRGAERDGLGIIGVFHSHPHGTPVPSATDVAGALEPEWAYVISGADGGLRAWSIHDGTVREIPLA